MRKFFLSLIAVAGLLGFASAAQAACNDMQMVDADSTTVATDNTTKPILPDQSGG